jgi:hypothetical protein
MNEKKFLNLFKIFASVFILWFLAHSLYIIIDGLSDHGQNADLAVILGK